MTWPCTKTTFLSRNKVRLASSSTESAILTQGELEMSEIPEKTTGKPGKLAKSDAHNLLARLRLH
jgi:hypothetical protein